MTRPLPRATRITEPFWAGTKSGKLLLEYCRSCNRHQFYPRGYCLQCLSEELTWSESTGRGVIYTFTVNHRAQNEYLKSQVPFAVGVVTLSENVKMMGRLISPDLSSLSIGAQVRVVFEQASLDIALPQFEVIGEK